MTGETWTSTADRQYRELKKLTSGAKNYTQRSTFRKRFGQGYSENYNKGSQNKNSDKNTSDSSGQTSKKPKWGKP